MKDLRDLCNSDIQELLKDLEKRINLTTGLKRNNHSVFSDEQVNNMHEKYLIEKSAATLELKNRGAL